MPDETDPTRLLARIKLLHTLFFALFTASIGVLIMQQTTFGSNALTMTAWAATLGGAVAVRFYRRTLIKQYDAVVGDEPPPRPRAKKR